MPVPTTLAGFMAAAYGRGCEATLAELASLFGFSLERHQFETSADVQKRLDEYGLVLVPALPNGSFESPRLVCCDLVEIDEKKVRSELSEGESAIIEFKSSLLFDHRRALSGNFRVRADLRSDMVLDSALKTVAAFMNADGGVLYIGVDDASGCIGISQDFEFLGAKANIDGWELFFRDKVKAHFHDGVTANSFIRIRYFELDGVIIARLQVSATRSIAYLKRSDRSAFEVLVRQGNRTVSLSMPEFEAFVRERFAVAPA